MSDDELVDRLRRALHTEAETLTPHQGTPRVTPVAVRHRRHVRARTAAYVALATAAAVAAVVVIGMSLTHRSPTSVNVSAGNQTPSNGGNQSTSHAGKAQAATSAPKHTQVPVVTTTTAPTSSTTAPASHSVQTVSADFVPLSATFVSLDDGWVLGVQRCSNGSSCLELDATTDRGAGWTEIAGPPVSGLALPTAANSYARPDLQVRFASPLIGWVFGNVGGSPVLYWTNNGGATWAQDSISSLGATSIVDIETANRSIQMAYVAKGGGIGIASSPVITASGAPNWTAASFSQAALARSASSGQLVLQGTGGWLLETNPAGLVVGGAQFVNGAWENWTAPCEERAGLLAAATANDLVAVCGQAGQQQVKTSSNAGTSFQSTSTTLGTSAVATTAASSGATLALLGTSRGNVVYLPRSGTSSLKALAAADVPQGQTIEQVGFEDSTDGILITSDGTTGGLYVTSDGGQSWTSVDLQG
jgi:hypothetical protein